MAARRDVQFDDIHGPGSYQRLVRLLMENRWSMAEIGALFGISKQAVHQNYQRLVREGILVSGRAQARAEEQSQASGQTRLHATRPSAVDALQKVVGDIGLTVSPHPRQRGSAHQKIVRIGTHLCWIATAVPHLTWRFDATIQSGTAYYAWHCRSIASFREKHPEIGFLILSGGTDWYCIPIADATTFIYLPMNPTKPSLRSPWLVYREAFGLLK